MDDDLWRWLQNLHGFENLIILGLASKLKFTAFFFSVLVQPVNETNGSPGSRGRIDDIVDLKNFAGEVHNWRKSPFSKSRKEKFRRWTVDNFVIKLWIIFAFTLLSRLRNCLDFILWSALKCNKPRALLGPLVLHSSFISCVLCNAVTSRLKQTVLVTASSVAPIFSDFSGGSSWETPGFFNSFLGSLSFRSVVAKINCHILLSQMIRGSEAN